MRGVAIIVALLLLVSVSSLAAEVSGIPDGNGKFYPFTLQLKDLDDGPPYFRFTTSYITGGGWLSAMSRYGGEGVPAYTQFQWTNIGNGNYLIVYVVDAKGGDTNFMYGTPNPNAPAPEPITENSSLYLVLLSQQNLTMSRVRPFNLTTELADYQRYLTSYQEMVASRSAMNRGVSLAPVPPDNLKNLAIALDMFIGDHDGVLPAMDTPENFRKALDDYVENEDAFKDPETQEFYSVNPSLSGKKITDIKNTGQTIAIYQTAPGKDGKRGVVLVDLTVKRLTEAEWTDLKAKSNIP